MLEQYKNVLWDFDGVIIDSMPIREQGFREILQDFAQEQVEELVRYHRANGGLSRFIKIRYFFEVILHTTITEEQVQLYATRFSETMRKLLCNKELLIEDAVQYIRENSGSKNFHVVSASEEQELRFLCEQLGLAGYFKSINGSPTAKTVNVQQVLKKYGYEEKETCLIGDSINDRHAALGNDIQFFGYNSELLKQEGPESYIQSFSNLN